MTKRQNAAQRKELIDKLVEPMQQAIAGRLAAWHYELAIETEVGRDLDGLSDYLQQVAVGCDSEEIEEQITAKEVEEMLSHFDGLRARKKS